MTPGAMAVLTGLVSQAAWLIGVTVVILVRGRRYFREQRKQRELSRLRRLNRETYVPVRQEQLDELAGQLNALVRDMTNRGLISGLEGNSSRKRDLVPDTRQPDLREWAMREFPELRG